MPTLSASAIRFALPHVSKEVSRPILNGIHCEPSGVISATDGKTLLMHSSACTGFTRSVILSVPKLPAKTDSLTFELPADGGPIMARALDRYGREVGVVVLREVEGPFPNVRGVLPSSDPAPLTSISLDPALVERFSIKDAGPVVLEFFGDTSAIRVSYFRHEGIAGLIMPVRSPGTPSTEWMRGSATWPVRVDVE
jgi:hypothetical protein